MAVCRSVCNSVLDFLLLCMLVQTKMLQMFKDMQAGVFSVIVVVFCQQNVFWLHLIFQVTGLPNVCEVNVSSVDIFWYASLNLRSSTINVFKRILFLRLQFKICVQTIIKLLSGS